MDSPCAIRLATPNELDAIKAIADRERHALGFVHRGSLARAVARDELFVAFQGTGVVGFCQFYRRRDGVVTIYHLAVMPEARNQRIGTSLITHVLRDAKKQGMTTIRLKCPSGLLANAFYARTGFECVGSEKGTRRILHIWERRLAGRGEDVLDE